MEKHLNTEQPTVIKWILNFRTGGIFDIMVFHPSTPPTTIRIYTPFIGCMKAARNVNMAPGFCEVEHGAFTTISILNKLPNAQPSTKGLLIKSLKREEACT